MRTLSLILLSVTILTGISIGDDNIGSDASGPWKIDVRTNMIFRGSSRQIIETVVTNRITQEEYQHLQKVAAEEKRWREQVALVHVGMRRDEVEKLLPPFTEPMFGVANGSGYSLSYWVDKHWMVAMWYDPTGYKGKTATNTFAENRIFLFPPRLAKREIPSYVKEKPHKIPTTTPINSLPPTEPLTTPQRNDQ